MADPIYLDYAAATPVDPKVRTAMESYFSGNFYNPSATYLAAREVRQRIEQARKTVAGLLGARPAEIVFTSGATEANNLAIAGIMRQHLDSQLLVSTIEHESVLAPAGRWPMKTVKVNDKGLINLKDLAERLSDNVVLISIMLVNNELGTIQPLREIATLIEKERQRRAKASQKLPIYLHTDAAQAGNFLDLHISRLGVDMMSLNGAKIYGPKQAGALYVKAGTVLEPIILGGGQERGLRSGTESAANIVGLATALEVAQAMRVEEALRINQLRNLLKEKILQISPSIFINGSDRHMAPHILSAVFPNHDNERLMMELDERGVQCAAGSACSADEQEASHVLTAIGLDEAAARASLRFSLGRQTTEADISKTAEILRAVLVAQQ